MANSPLKFFIPGQGSAMSQVMKQFQESRKDPFKQAKEAPRQKVGFGGPQTPTPFQPAITPQQDMTPKPPMPSKNNNMTTNMTDDKVYESDQGNNVGLTGKGPGSSAIVNGPDSKISMETNNKTPMGDKVNEVRGDNYSDLVSGSGAMNKIKDNTSTPFTMKESAFNMDDLSGDNKITQKDVLIGKGVIDEDGNKIEN